MGNCKSSFTPSLPSASAPAAPIQLNTAANVSYVNSALPFAPILPFTTPSNLAAVYVLGSQLGLGQSGVIYNCTSRASGALFACKSISKLHLRTARDVDDAVREVRIMKHLSHAIRPSHASTASPAAPHINCLPGSVVRLYDIIEDETSVHLILELCQGGELFNRIVKKKCYAEAQAVYIIKSLLEIVQFCHSMGIMHRDIKPENILLVEDSDTSPIKLADFGLALEFSPGQKFSGVAGSTYYIAPEVLQGEYSEEVDMWSVGVIMYMLLSGVPPFWGTTERRIFKAIQKGDLSFPSNPWDKISSLAKDLIAQMLHTDAKLRLTPAQALKHPWILHNAEVSEHAQSDLTSRTLSVSNKAGNVNSYITTGAPTPNEAFGPAHHHNETLLLKGMSNGAGLELSTILLDMIARMDRNPSSVSDSLAKQRWQNGWTCTILSLDENEETLVVDMGSQVKYLISHDRAKKKIGWKLYQGDIKTFTTKLDRTNTQSHYLFGM